MEISASVLVQHINSLVWGTGTPREDIFARWCQGFRFSSLEPTALCQETSGPCAVIAAVQAAILREVLCRRRVGLPIPTDFDSGELLVLSLIEIFETVSHGERNSTFFFFRWDGSFDEGAYSGGKTPFQEFVDGLKLVSLDSTDELQAIIMSLIPQIMSSYGLLCFLYSILLTHGLEDVKKGMVGETDTLIDPTFGSASQCLLNLLITGRSSPHLFDGERTLSGFTMQGVTAQPKTGFLTVVEALRYCEVGWYLKNPSTPIWILGSETHFTVLASDNRDLVSVEEPLSAPDNPQSTSCRPRANLRQAEREFTSLTENSDSGFLSYEQFEVLLDRLGLPVDQQSVAAAKGVIDSEGLGIILREPFLAYYYAEELQRESSPVSSFRLLHYNGLAASNSNGRIRYRYGEANLLDPVDDTNPTGSSPLDRCLKTKWPTIRVTWSNEPTPSLN
uniref:Ubiquitin carboxyl-terminal hydrolase MINDY n=3 Tax=Schistocephalus solidus TaxID=70667 RepID=A0A0X3PVS4_SCHSO